MNADQKKRALTALGMWHSSNDGSLREYQAAELMAALLQELIDAPESTCIKEPPGDLMRDAERWRYTAQDGYFEIRSVPESGVSWVVGIKPKRGTPEWRKGHIGIWTTGTGRTRTAAIDAAIERDKQKGGA